MIAYLKGKIIDLDSNKLVLLTDSGVGYQVGISDITYSELSIDAEIELYIYHHITENAMSLFGFLEKSEKQVFEELIKISGIGGRVALSILSLGGSKLAIAVRDNDKKTIESIKGIGKKMAEKIILELKDKDFITIISSNTTTKVDSTPKIEKSISDSVKSTLVAMGYNSKKIDTVLSTLPEGLKEVGEIIQYVIKEL